MLQRHQITTHTNSIEATELTQHMAEFVKTHRGGMALHYEGHKYSTFEKGGMVYYSGFLAPRRRRLREKERRLQSLFQRFELGTISIDDYLKTVKHLTGL